MITSTAELLLRCCCCSTLNSQPRLLFLLLLSIFLSSFHSIHAAVSGSIQEHHQPSKQNLSATIKHFRHFVAANPNNADGYNQLGAALLQLGITNDDAAMVRRAEQAFRASADVKGSSPSTMSNLKLVESHLHRRRGTATPTSDRNTATTTTTTTTTTATTTTTTTSPITKQQRRRGHDRLRERIRAECQEEQLRIVVRKQDHQAGHLPSGGLDHARRLLRLCGVVILEHLYEEPLISDLNVAQSYVLEKFLTSIEENPTLVNSTRSEQRSPGRYEVLSPLEYPFTSARLLRNPLLLPLIQKALSTSRIEIDTHSSVTSLSHTPEQHWHRDAGFLHHELVQEQLPPHGLVVFVPLVDIDDAMGPTMFLIGSHIKCETSEFVLIPVSDVRYVMECPFAGPVVQASAPKGSAIVFDLRVLHRGLANQRNTRRPQLYLTFFQEWFVDRVNFNMKQTSKFDRLSPGLRKMLSRVDTRWYMWELERQLVELGVDLSEL